VVPVFVGGTGVLVGGTGVGVLVGTDVGVGLQAASPRLKMTMTAKVIQDFSFILFFPFPVLGLSAVSWFQYTPFWWLCQ